jgi:hypothetical protein
VDDDLVEESALDALPCNAGKRSGSVPIDSPELGNSLLRALFLRG